VARDLPDEFLGERGPARARPPGDEQDPRAGSLLADQGVQAHALDVGPQLLQLPGTAQELALRRSVARQQHAARLHCL